MWVYALPLLEEAGFPALLGDAFAGVFQARMQKRGEGLALWPLSAARTTVARWALPSQSCSAARRLDKQLPGTSLELTHAMRDFYFFSDLLPLLWEPCGTPDSWCHRYAQDCRTNAGICYDSL